ncbi:MAG: EamA family transporter [candidate division KSB1 bacterium]|jgi:drug/metabolite transporter (DMT)-like permease|nr:EamA family transporter [candidate division KSB1 bacterium]
MISLILTILCSTCIALILKSNATRKGHPVVLLFGNYFVAAMISLIFLLTADNVKYAMVTFVFAAILAILFVTSFFLFAKAVESAGAALSQTSSRLSVVVPVMLSIFLLQETPSSFQIAGIFLAIVTIFQFYLSIRSEKTDRINVLVSLYLIGLLLGIGIADFSMKVFNVWRPYAEKPFFLFTIFAFAALYTGSIILFTRIRINRRTLTLGAALGVPNVFSTFFLLIALRQLPAIVVYPAVNIGIIVLTAIIATLFWRERMNAYSLFGLVCGLLSILLLNF